MDPVIAAAGRALAAGDPLGALKRVALRDDAAALALRGSLVAHTGGALDNLIGAGAVGDRGQGQHSGDWLALEGC